MLREEENGSKAKKNKIKTFQNDARKLKRFKTMHERWRISASIRFGARLSNLLVDTRRATAKHPDICDLRVSALEILEEGTEIRSTKVIHRLQPGEHTATAVVTAKVLLADVEHRRSKVEFMEILCDKDMNVQNVLCIKLFCPSKDVNEPFKVLMCRTDPHKVCLLAAHIMVSTRRFLQEEISQC